MIVGEELEFERAALAKGNRDIAEGEKRIARQHALIIELSRDGHDTKEAERTLLLLEQTLTQWVAHLTLIEERIAYLEKKRAGYRDP